MLVPERRVVGDALRAAPDTAARGGRARSVEARTEWSDRWACAPDGVVGVVPVSPVSAIASPAAPSDSPQANAAAAAARAPFLAAEDIGELPAGSGPVGTVG